MRGAFCGLYVEERAVEVLQRVFDVTALGVADAVERLDAVVEDAQHVEAGSACHSASSGFPSAA